MNKEEIPIEYYLTKNGEVIKFVRYDELDKYKQVLDKIKEYLNKVELGELENGKPYTFKDFLKEEKDAEIEEAKWLLELLEEIE